MVPTPAGRPSPDRKSAATSCGCALVAFDKFKDSLDAETACEIVAAVLREGDLARTIESAPLSDGGEGFVSILTKAVGGRMEAITVAGPLGSPIEAQIGLVDAGRVPAAARRMARIPSEGLIGIVEMAQAAGIEKVAVMDRDLFRTTTAGVGEMIAAVTDRGASAILMGIGGSATNDLGAGCLAALGVQFEDGAGREGSDIRPSDFSRIERIVLPEGSTLPPIRVACDVEHPLLGPVGATATFGPQKGLRPEDFDRLENGMERISGLILESAGKPPELRELPGTGAAGGIGFGLMAVFGAELVPGFGLLEAWLDLEERVARADWVLTGEGRFDRGSLGGKGPGAIARMAWEKGCRVTILAGSVDSGAAREVFRQSKGLASVRAITPDEMPLGEALVNTRFLLATALEVEAGLA